MLPQRDLSFIYKYFTGEKQESLLFLIIGVAAIALAIVFCFFIKSNPSFYKGAAIPLAAIGIIQCIVGYTVFARSDKQIVDIAYNIGMDPTSFAKQEELPRMETVMKNFVIYRYVEILLTLVGLGFFLFFLNDETKMFWKGIGLTLAIQALLMLGADYVAEKRGNVYKEELKKMITD